MSVRSLQALANKLEGQILGWWVGEIVSFLVECDLGFNQGHTTKGRSILGTSWEALCRCLLQRVVLCALKDIVGYYSTCCFKVCRCVCNCVSDESGANGVDQIVKAKVLSQQSSRRNQGISVDGGSYIMLPRTFFSFLFWIYFLFLSWDSTSPKSTAFMNPRNKSYISQSDLPFSCHRCSMRSSQSS